MTSSQPKKSPSGRLPSKKTLTIIAITCLALIGSAIALSSGENRELTFVREVPTSLSIDTLAKSLDWIPAWPRWHHQSVRVEVENVIGQPYALTDQVAQPGTILKMYIEPPEKKHKKFDLRMQILDYEPRKFVKMRLLEDSKAKLNRMFTQIEWTVEIIPGTPLGAPKGELKGAHQPTTTGATVRGTLTARTVSARARFFANVSERILMNQIFYPNLIALAELKDPEVIRAEPPKAKTPF